MLLSSSKERSSHHFQVKEFLSVLNVNGTPIAVSYESNRMKKKSSLTLVWDSFLLYKCTWTMNSKSFLSCFNQKPVVDKNLDLNHTVAHIYANKTLQIQRQEHLLNYIFKSEFSGFCGLSCLYAPRAAFLFCPLLIYKIHFTQSQKVCETNIQWQLF